MNTIISIEPMSEAEFSENPQKACSVSYTTSITLETPREEAWEIIKWIVENYIPNAKLEVVTKDFSFRRYCFSALGTFIPEALDIPIDV